MQKTPKKNGRGIVYAGLTIALLLGLLGFFMLKWSKTNYRGPLKVLDLAAAKHFNEAERNVPQVVEELSTGSNFLKLRWLMTGDNGSAKDPGISRIRNRQPHRCTLSSRSQGLRLRCRSQSLPRGAAGGQSRYRGQCRLCHGQFGVGGGVHPVDAGLHAGSAGGGHRQIGEVLRRRRSLCHRGWSVADRRHHRGSPCHRGDDMQYIGPPGSEASVPAGHLRRAPPVDTGLPKRLQKVGGTMKALLSLLLAASLVLTVCAAPMHRYRLCRRIRRTPRVKLRCPSWKTVAAGGIAAGTVIAAYKVSDGVEESIKTVAKEHPEEFSNSLSILTWPLRWGLLILMLVSGWWLWRKSVRNKNNQRKDPQNEDRSVEE